MSVFDKGLCVDMAKGLTLGVLSVLASIFIIKLDVGGFCAAFKFGVNLAS